MERLEDIKDLWEDKYVVNKTCHKGTDEENYYYDYEDKWGATLYSVNHLGEIQRFYINRSDYLKAIKPLPEDYPYGWKRINGKKMYVKIYDEKQ